MTDRGLDEAIRAAGGITELARRIGISQPSVSNWSRVPAERVLSVEAVTGVARAVLRPDLYADAPISATMPMPRARAEYALLATLLTRAPTAAFCGQREAARRCDAARPGARGARASGGGAAERVGREFFDLFIGVGRGELLPYGSYYLTGFLNERPLARLREDLGRLGIERAEQRSRAGRSRGDPVRDHGRPRRRPLCRAVEQRPQIFDNHVAPWIGRFFADLEAPKRRLLPLVGTVGRLFIAIETEAFALPG